MCQTLIANTAYQNGRTEAGSRCHLRNLRPRRKDLKPNETHYVVSSLLNWFPEQHNKRPALLLQRQTVRFCVWQSSTGTECTFCIWAAIATIKTHSFTAFREGAQSARAASPWVQTFPTLGWLTGTCLRHTVETVSVLSLLSLHNIPLLPSLAQSIFNVLGFAVITGPPKWTNRRAAKTLYQEGQRRGTQVQKLSYQTSHEHTNTHT